MTRSQKISCVVACRLNQIVDSIILLMFVSMLLTGIYLTMDVAYVFYHADPDKIPVLKRIYDTGSGTYTMDDLSDECVGWLTIYDTDIDYPIMQASNNNKYLNLSPQGEYSLSGSIFLDYRNSAWFLSDYLLVYGHHMSNGFMFGALDYYESEVYMQKHKKGVLLRRDGTRFDVEIFAYAVVDASDAEVFRPGQQQELDEFIKKRSLNRIGDGKGPIIMALTTCRADPDSARTVVFCVLSDHMEAGTEPADLNRDS